ncbi:hypothetical protein DL98DRAFT_654467 [Cadophora sp. DSE1049]|nr:hypothetical protein DL98DRAFT_654467 [Cadophora sp. DSE1049]
MSVSASQSSSTSGMSSETQTGESFTLGNPFLEEFHDTPFSYLYDGSCDPDDGDAALFPVARGNELDDSITGKVWERRASILGFDEVQRCPEASCKVRIVFFHAPDQYSTQQLASLSHTLGIPNGFWDFEDNGSVSRRKYICIRMMLKNSEGDRHTYGFQSACFLLKENDNISSTSEQFPTTAFICVIAPLPFRRRIHAAFNTNRRGSNDYISEVMLDPFRVVSLNLMSWYRWNSQLFWALRDNMLALEIFNSKNITNGRTEFGYMHLLAKDMIQAIELMEFAVVGVRSVQSICPNFRVGVLDQVKLDAMDETKAALDYHLLRFEGVLFRTRALLKRMDNQISLAYNLAQQRDAKISQRNSDSVSTISFLTLLFLPATAFATIFSTPFFKPSEVGFTLKVLPSVVYYWIVTIPVTVFIVSVWHWWRRRETKPGNSPITARPALSHPWSRWVWTKAKRQPKKNDEEITSLDLEGRPRSPHFWQYEPKWPLPQDR